MAGSIYQTVFGGNTVAPAIPTYLSLSISANVILGWPLESNITAPAAAEIIDVTATVGGLTIQLSDARQVGVGYCALFNNVGANTFSVLDASGATIASIASGQAWQIYISDNSTLAGTWRVFQYGAGTSSANAATLAGNGLKAITTTLNERIFINAQGSNYAIQNTDRAACVEWTGGSGGTFTAPTPATVGSDWFCYIKNAGTGVLTLSPAAGNIDGTSSKSFNPNDSCILISDGANLFTMGFGQSVASSFNFVTISLAGASGNVVLNGAQLNRISYKFTGALAGNTTVVVPASIQQYWIDNETTGAFTLTISAGGAGTTFTVPQANRTILYCDGLNIVNAISSGSIQFADGTAAAPSITFASDLTLGFYKAGTDVLGISTAGVQRGTINSAGAWVINAPGSGTALITNGNAEILRLTSTTARGSGNAYLDFFDPTGVKGYLGYVIGTDDYYVNNALTGALNLQTASATRIAIGSTGNVIVNAPSSGTTLVSTASGAGGLPLQVQGVASTNGGLIQFFDTTNSLNRGYIGGGGLITGQAVADFGIAAATGNFLIGRQGGTAIAVSVNSAGNVTVNAPSSGTTLTVTGIASQYAGFFTGGGAAGTQRGLSVVTSTQNAADKIFNVNNSISNLCDIFGDGHGDLGPNLSWTTGGAWTIGAPTSGRALVANGLSGTDAVLINGGSTAGSSFGLNVLSGTNSSDYSIQAVNQAGSVTYFKVRGDGQISGGGPVAAALVDMTPDQGSWTTTLSGPFTANPTGTLNWRRMGGIVTIWAAAAIQGTTTSSANISASGLPAAITPAANKATTSITVVSGVAFVSFSLVTTSNTITFSVSSAGPGFNTYPTGNSSTGLGAGWSISYSL